MTCIRDNFSEPMSEKNLFPSPENLPYSGPNFLGNSLPPKQISFDIFPLSELWIILLFHRMRLDHDKTKVRGMVNSLISALPILSTVV